MVYIGVNSFNDSPGHHCGVVGIHSKEPRDLPEYLFYSLFALQHRGQESAGISYLKDNTLVAYKDLGMVSSVLSRYLKDSHPTTVGIGHVRYSTRGGNKLENAQPIVVSCNKGNLALAHNGNLSNIEILKQELFQEGSIFQTTSDTELILHMISRSPQSDFYEALLRTLERLEGAYSMVMAQDSNLLIMRDPWGFRPLYIGEKDGMVMAASETCALDILQADTYREVEAGEIIRVNNEGVESDWISSPISSKRISQCVFELIYFARPDSKVFNTSVHLMRKKIGAALADCDSFTGDVVVPVPDSGNIAALGYAEQSGIPFDMSLTRNHYAGRSFILPTTAQRELAVRMKLHPVREAIRGKRVILVDDSLVRGTTSKILVRLMKEAGAKEVHLRLSSPEITNPCYYGIDIPTREELISNRMDPNEIARYIGADSVQFIPLEKLKECVVHPEDYCFACFSGNYPVQPKKISEQGDRNDKKNGHIHT